MRIILNIPVQPNDFKLFGIVFVEECNRDSHNAVTLYA